MGKKEMDTNLAAAEDKFPSRRESRAPAPSSRSPCHGNQRGQRNNVVEVIGQVHGGCVVSRDNHNGVVRMKIVMSKQQLRQMVLSTGHGRSNAGNTPPPPPSLEQLLHILRRRHVKRADAVKGHRSCWRPALQSIPEEL